MPQAIQAIQKSQKVQKAQSLEKPLATLKNYLSRIAINPLDLITENGRWTSTTYMYLITYAIIFLLCFLISLSSYKEDDPTPLGYKLIYAFIAGLWNIVYLLYFIMFRL
jgi:hypothetical protein